LDHAVRELVIMPSPLKPHFAERESNLMRKKTIQPPTVPVPKVKSSPGVLAGKTLYVSGMLAMDAQGAVVGVGNIEAQTRHVLESIRAVVEAAGGRMDHVVHNAIFLKDFAHYTGMNKVYADYFAEDPPARYCVRADLFRDECLVEISTIAHLD
jgi:aminoacrylate peracid reductase